MTGEWHMCYKCMRGCKIAYMAEDKNGKEVPTCAKCMKNAKIKNARTFLIAKYERHLTSLSDEEVNKIFEKHTEKV